MDSGLIVPWSDGLMAMVPHGLIAVSLGPSDHSLTASLPCLFDPTASPSQASLPWSVRLDA